jgi:pSer/pThr/pTyr-binding forkhead associated (FHA) protein/tetratricopeptide (TPR) repeat protein
MSNGSPPARRRPTAGSSPGGTGQRPAVRKTSSQAIMARSEPLSTTGTRLVCMAGPHSGAEFPLEEGEYVIGRASDNPICIPDTSVSRRHVMIRQLGGGWVASDLGSGNGTFLNGEPINDETPLAHGDLLTLGDTELLFQDTSNATMMMAMPVAPSAAAAPSRPARGRTGNAPALPAGEEAEAPAAAAPRRPPPRPEARVRTSRGRSAVAQVDPAAQKRKKRLLLLTATAFVMLAGLLAAMKMKQQEEAELAIAEARAIQERRAALDALFQEAKNLIREGKWVDAKARLLELKEQEPNYLLLEDYLARAEKEIPNQQEIQAAKEALEKGQLGEAASALNKVGRDTQLFEEVRTLRATLAQKAELRVREAQVLLDAKSLDEAKAITDDVLAAIPDHRNAKVIGEQVARAIEIRDKPPPPPPVRAAPKPWDQASDQFQTGDLQGAVAMANACAGKHSQCRALLGQMTEFGNLYKKLENLDDRGLSRLLELDRKITHGRGSVMARKAGTRAATIFYKSASAAKAAGQWGRAMDYARRALQADPGHAGASAMVAELRQKAKDIYMQAYALKDTNPDDAVPKLREVVSMTAPDDETHQKAKSWIEKLSR